MDGRDFSEGLGCVFKGLIVVCLAVGFLAGAAGALVALFAARGCNP